MDSQHFSRPSSSPLPSPPLPSPPLPSPPLPFPPLQSPPLPSHPRRVQPEADVEVTKRHDQEHPGRDSVPRSHHLPKHPPAGPRLEEVDHHRPSRLRRPGQYHLCSLVRDFGMLFKQKVSKRTLSGVCVGASCLLSLLVVIVSVSPKKCFQSVCDLANYNMWHV